MSRYLIFVGERWGKTLTETAMDPAFRANSLHRLAKWAGVDPLVLRATGYWVNLQADAGNARWDTKKAMGAAAELRHFARAFAVNGTEIRFVLLGRRVAQAFFDHVPKESVRSIVTVIRERFTEGNYAYELTYTLFPHPSGRNRFWNDPTHRKMGGTMLRAVLAWLRAGGAPVTPLPLLAELSQQRPAVARRSPRKRPREVSRKEIAEGLRKAAARVRGTKLRDCLLEQARRYEDDEEEGRREGAPVRGRRDVPSRG